MTLDLLSQIFGDPLVICTAAISHFAFFGARLVFYRHFSRQARAGKKNDHYYHSGALAGMGAPDGPRDALGHIIRRFGTSPVDGEEGWDAQAIADWESRRQLRVINSLTCTSTGPNPSQGVDEVIIRETSSLGPPPVSLLIA